MAESQGVGGGLMPLPDTENIEVLSTQSGAWIGLDFHVTFPNETTATVVRVSLNPGQAGRLLVLLSGMHKQFGFPLPEGATVTDVIQ